VISAGKKIRQLRKQYNLSMNELAKLAGVGQSTLSYIESGKRQPSLEVLERICKALNITMSEFFSDEELKLPSDLRQLLKEVERLTPSQRKKLVEFIRVMKG